MSNESERMSIKQNVSNRITEHTPQFFDVYSVCSHLIAEIGREAVRSWNGIEIESKMEKFIDHMVVNGFPRQKALLAWKLIVEGNPKNDPSSMPTLRPSSAVFSMVEDQGSSRAREENVFSFEGGRWVVRFQGKTVYPGDITGIKYIHRLISQSGNTISAQDLYDDFGGKARRKQPNSISRLDAVQSGLRTDFVQSDVLIDERGRSEMLKRLDVIELEMMKAKGIPDADLIEKLATERISIQGELRKAFTPVGSRRIQEPERVRRMKAVDIAIRRAKEKIEKAGHRSLVIHLDETIEVKVKSGCSYKPDSSVAWRTQPASFIAQRRPR